MVPIRSPFFNFVNMACDLTMGRTEPCKESVGGIDAIYFVDFGALGEPTIGTDDEITDFDGTFDYYKYDVKSSATTYEEAINSSRDNGTTFFTQTVNLTLKKLTKKMHKELKLIAFGRPHVIIEDRNGNAFVAGLNRGCEVTGGSVVTGGAMGDLSGYTLTLEGQEELPANFLEGAVAGDPFAGMNSATENEGTQTDPSGTP